MLCQPEATMKNLLPTLLAILIPFTAAAATVGNAGDWQLDDTVPGDSSKGLCVASTAGYMGNVVVSLAVVIDKTGARPIELMLQPTKKVGASAMYVRSDSGANFYLAKLASGNQYWAIPVNTERFIGELLNGNQINFFAVSGTAEQLPLSLNGSTAMINMLRSRCGKNSVNVADFEKTFLPENADRFDIRNISPANADELRATVAQSIPLYRKLKSILAELAALNARNQALIDERAQLQQDLARLINVVVPDLTNRRDAAQAQIDRANNEIADLTSQISIKQAELIIAQSVAKGAYDRYAPLVAEHDRLLGLRQSDEQRLSNARSTLANIDNNIASDENQISDLNAEASRLQNQLPQAQYDVQRGQQSLDEADRAYRSYDVRDAARHFFFEDRRRGELEQQQQQLVGAHQQYQAQVQQAQGALQAAQNSYNSAVSSLNQCRGGHASVLNSLGRVLAGEDNGSKFGGGMGGFPGRGGPGGGGFGGPGRPGPQPPVPPTPPAPPVPVPVPPTPVNCSAQEAVVANAQGNLNNAVNVLNQAQANLNNVTSQLQNVNAQMEQIRNEAEWHARQIQQDLANRVSQAQQYLSQLQNTVASIQNRLNNIIQFDLPRAQNDLASNENRRPGAVANLQNAERVLAGSTANFDNYLAQTDYLAIDAEKNRTAGVVSQIQNTIASHQAGIRSRQALIAQQTALRDSLIRQIAENNAVIARKQARLAVVNTALAAYDVQKNEIQGRIDIARADLKVVSDQYGAKLR
jgi:peptidoglycan hydrolase CwlO-like protein